jgi:signal transduction histidine kinase
LVQLPSAIDRASLAGEQAALRREASLRRIATLVAGGVTAGELFSAVAREVSVVLEVPVVTVGRYELEGGSPVSVVLASREHAGFPVGSRWPLDGAGTREVYENRRPTRIEDFAGLNGTLASAARQQAMNWVVGAPIIVDGAVWGNIYAGTAGDEPIPEDAESRLADFTDLVAIAIANSEARENVGQLVDEQAALRRVATLVARGVRPHEIFSAVSEEVGRVFRSHHSGVGRFELDGSAVVIVGVSEGISNIPIGTRWPLEDFLATTAVYRTGRPARNERSGWEDASGPVANSLRELGLVSTVAAPIVVESNVWGVITVSDAHQRLPPDAEERLAAFTELVATAIANAESRDELAASEARARKLAEEQTALRRVATLAAGVPVSEHFFSTVAREVASVLSVPGVIVTRYEADGTVATFGEAFDSDLAGAERFLGVGTRMPRDPGSLAAQVFETHRTARIDDFSTIPGTIGDLARAAGLGSGCASPIVVDGELWGKICVFSGAGTVLPAGTENRLHDFIELAATAIANYEARADLAASEARARGLASEQAALRRVATLVAQGASPDELFSAVAEEVAGIIDIPVVGIHRYEADGTFTTMGIAGETSLRVGTRCGVKDEGMAGMILATGEPSRRDDYAGVPHDAVREDLRLPMVGVPIIVEGSIWGFMVAAAKPGRPIAAGAEERLARFTELVATAVSNANTRTELLTSRARVVNAADETRRRLERDLHDGIQQWLVALALRARKAVGLSAAGESVVQELSGLADDLVAVTDELRELSRGIHPAILSDAGLDDALEALARRSAIRVDLEVSFQGRYDPTLEATVYYVAAESITNAVKHAQASTVTVRGGRRNGAVELEIRDDGVGGADPRRGTGLIGLKDRVDTLGGTISFASPAGAGTTIRVKLPVGPRDGENPGLPRSNEATSAQASG